VRTDHQPFELAYAPPMYDHPDADQPGLVAIIGVRSRALSSTDPAGPWKPLGWLIRQGDALA